MADADWFLWAPKWQGRLKAFTLIACTLAVVSNATADWDSELGEHHCFSGVKPGVKRMMNSLFGVTNVEDVAKSPLQRQPAEQ